MKRSRKLAWVVLGVVVALALALVVFLTSPLWVWFAYETETILLVEYPLKMTSPHHGFRDHSKPTHERIARKKRFGRVTRKSSADRVARAGYAQTALEPC